MNRNEALSLVKKLTKNNNLVKHMLAVEAEMRALAKHFKEDENSWALAGLLHDADYEMHNDDPEKHPSTILDILKKENVDEKIIHAIHSHAWRHQTDAPKPESKMEWALYTCDDLSGLIIATALVRPDKKLSSVTTKSVMKKWNTKAFAAGADRQQISLCEEYLNIPLKDYVTICLEGIQKIAPELGL